LVVDDAIQAVQKTKSAIAVLKTVGAYTDVQKAKDSRKLRRGVGKMRNRRHVQRRGPLVVFAEDKGVSKAFRNLPGVELAHVDSLNLLQLAPGGHLGRFCIWTKSAFQKLNDNWGSVSRVSTQKKGYTLPTPVMANSDLTRIINSDEVQSKLRPADKVVKRSTQKKNPLRNFGALVKLNPYALALRRAELLSQERRQKAVQSARKYNHGAQQKKNYQNLVDDSLFPVASAPVVQETVTIGPIVPLPKPKKKEKLGREVIGAATTAAPAKKAAKAAPAAKAAAPAAKAAPKK